MPEHVPGFCLASMLINEQSAPTHISFRGRQFTFVT